MGNIFIHVYQKADLFGKNNNNNNLNKTCKSSQTEKVHSSHFQLLIAKASNSFINFSFRLDDTIRREFTNKFPLKSRVSPQSSKYEF